MTEPSPIPPEPSRNQAPGESRTRVIIGAVLILVAIVVTLVIYGTAQTRTITLSVDGIAQSLQTRSFTVGALLNEQNIILNSDDQVTPPVDSVLNEGQVVRVDRAHRVLIQINDIAFDVALPGNSPAEILANMGAEIQDDARVFVNGEEIDVTRLAETRTEPISQIVIRNPQPFNVVINSAGEENPERLSLYSSAVTVGAALYETGVELYLADAVTPELSAPLLPELEVHIQRAQPVALTVDGITLTTRVLNGTVADALSAAGIALMGQDYAIPDLNALIAPDTTIRVIRVKENLLTETRAIPFETIYQEVSDLDAGTGQIVQEGRDGMEQVVTRIRLEDGEETERTVIRRTLLVAPQPQIIARAS